MIWVKSFISEKDNMSRLSFESRDDIRGAVAAFSSFFCEGEAGCVLNELVHLIFFSQKSGCCKDC